MLDLMQLELVCRCSIKRKQHFYCIDREHVYHIGL